MIASKRLCLVLFLFVISTASVGRCGKIAVIRLKDIEAFHVQHDKVIIDKMSDLNESVDVLGIFRKIKEIEKKGTKMAASINDTEIVCIARVNHRIGVIMDNLRELCDHCIETNVDEIPSNELNTNQKNCLFDVLQSSEREIERLYSIMQGCALKKDSDEDEDEGDNGATKETKNSESAEGLTTTMPTTVTSVQNINETEATEKSSTA